MGKTGLRSKACVVPVAVAASLGMAGMGLVSDGIVAADTTSVTDTINVTVQPSCTFSSVTDETYAGSAANGTEVNNFNDSGIHEFNLFCNDNNGYIVTATPYDLEATGIEDVISYTDNYTHTGVNSMWTAEIASETVGVTVVNPVVPVGGGTIISSDSHTTAAGATFTAAYSAYVGTATPAETYTGTIVYTLTASGTSNGGSSGSGETNQNNDNNDDESGDSGTNSGSEVANNAVNNDDSGDSDSSDAGSNTKSVIVISDDSNNTPSNAQNASPVALNNTYNTYSTTNTYNTTNYSGSGASTPVATNTQDVASGNSSNGVSSNKNDDNAGVSDSYEEPLGVTTNITSASDEKTGIDWVPIIVTGAALAVAGVAVITTAQSKKEG